jgi:hypothetical protein
MNLLGGLAGRPGDGVKARLRRASRAKKETIIRNTT